MLVTLPYDRNATAAPLYCRTFPVSIHKLIAVVTRAISMGRTVRLGRWRAVYNNFSNLIEIEYGDDTQEIRAGAEPAEGWWIEASREWPGEAAEAIVKFWLADNGRAQ